MIVGLWLDLGTKAWAFAVLPNSGPDGHRFIPDWLHFTITTNRGAVFGWGEGNRVLFVGVSIAAIAFLTWLFATSGRQRLYQFILGMLLAGVLGNLHDRIVYGHVRDMIYALPNWTWPGTWVIPFIDYPGRERLVFPWVFNVADVLLCTGVGLLVVYSLFQPRREASEGHADGEAGQAEVGK